MRIVRDNLEGEVFIREDSELHGTIAGNATIHRNVTFRIYGIITGNLFIEEGATVYLHGIVKRNVINLGNDFRIFGTINGTITGERTYIQGGKSRIRNVI